MEPATPCSSRKSPSVRTPGRRMRTPRGIAAAGCGPSAPPVYEVRGQVTLNGVALPDAQIQFWHEVRGYDPPFARSASDGSYRVLARAGQYTVRILAQKTVPAPPGTSGASG